MFQDIGLRFIALGAGEFRREIASSRSALTGMENDLRKAAGSSAGFGTQLTALGSSMSRFGQMMTTSVTLPILLLEGALIGAGISFEDAFAGVGKTVEGVSDDFGNLTAEGIKIRDEFRALALEIPISVNELARIGETAGQLGIARSELTEFVETVALLGVTTNMTSEEAATFFARLGNIMGVAAEDMAEFTAQAGSTVVELGNKFAATEQEIAHLSLRIAGAGQAAGLSTQEILALATAMSSLGIQSEMGGSAISRVLLEVKRATDDFTATGGEATDQLKLFAEAAGVTVDQFTALVKNSPEEALLSLLGGINRLQESGMLTNDMLKTMNLDTIRLQDVMNRLGPNIDFVRTALTTANAEWESGNALQIEAQKRFNTTKSQLILLKNAFVDLGIEIFYLLKGPIDGVIKTLRTVITGFRNLDDGVLKSAMKFGLLLAAVGPVLTILGTVMQVLGILVTGFGAVSAPILVVVGAFVLLGTAVSQNFLGIRDRLEDLAGTAKKVGSAFKYVGKWIGKAFSFGLSGGGQGKNIFSGLSSAVQALTYVFKDAETTFFSKILQAFGMQEGMAQQVGMTIRNILTPALLFVSSVLMDLSDIFNIVTNTATAFFGSFFEFLPSIAPALQSAFQGLLSGDTERVITSLQIAWTNFVTWFQVSGAPILRQGIDALLTVFRELIVKVVPVVIELTAAFIRWAVDAAQLIIPLLVDFLGVVVKWIIDQLPTIRDKLLDWGKALIGWIEDAAPGLLANLLDFYGRIGDWVTDTLPKLIERGVELADAFLEWVSDVTRDIGPELGYFLGSLIGWVTTSLVPYLVAEGPIWAAKFISFVAEAVKTVGPELLLFSAKLIKFFFLDLPKATIATILAFGKGIVDGIKKGIEDNWGEFTEWIKDKIGEIPVIGEIALEILSPSKVMARLGKNVVLGLQEGMESQWPAAFAVAENMFSSLPTSLNVEGMMSPYTNIPANNINNISNASTRIFSPTINGANVSNDKNVGNEVLRAYRMAVLTHG